MTDESIPREAWGSCHWHDCVEPLPWDMPAIAINRINVFCSPSCARESLKDIDEPVREVRLHDPKFHADRELVGLPDSGVDIWCEVKSRADARPVIEHYERIHKGPFQVPPEL